MLSGDNGILQKATTAKTETEKGQEQEIVTLAYNSALAKKVSNGDSMAVTSGDLNAELTNQGASADGSNPIKVTFVASKRQYTVDNGIVSYAGIKNGNEQNDNELPTALGTKPYFPSDKFKQLDGTDLTTGLVITDKSENEEVGNEYVWIEVPSTAVDSTATQGPDYSGVLGATDYTNIATALRNYCTKDTNNENLITVTDGTESTKDYNTTTCGWKDEYFEGCGIANSEAYTILYNKMLKSVYENGGFWIGRYEAGITSPRNSGDSANAITPLSKIDQYPINWVTCSEAQTIACNLPNKGNNTSSLMFGIQWDLVLKHLNNKGVIKNLLTRDSKSWGNYDLEYNLNQTFVHGFSGILSLTDFNTLMWNSINSEYTHSACDWSSNGPIALSTGATTRNMQKNIYDLAGNLNEWTLEHSSSIGSPSVYRGGSFTNGSSGDPNYYPASLRNSTSQYGSGATYGFRVCIY